MKFEIILQNWYGLGGNCSYVIALGRRTIVYGGIAIKVFKNWCFLEGNIQLFEMIEWNNSTPLRSKNAEQKKKEKKGKEKKTKI